MNLQSQNTMKAKILNTLAIMTFLLLCATGRAQYILYSNAFNGSTYNTVDYTPVNGSATTFMGASASAVWACTFTNLNPAVNNPGGSYGVNNYGAGTVYLNGAISTNQGCALLPLTVQTNAVYILTASVTLPSPGTTGMRMGFTANNGAGVSPYFQTNIGFCRFNDSPPNGYLWNTMEVGANTGLYPGPKANSPPGQDTSGDLTTSAGTYITQIILSTLNNTNMFALTNLIGHGATNYWFAYAYMSSVGGTSPTNQIGTNVIIAASASGAPPYALNDCGLGSAGLSIGGNPSGNQWNWFTVSTPLAPMIIQRPVSATVNQNANFTNTVMALADTNGGALVYQWYTNGIPLSNGGNISGATNASLIINGIIPGQAGTDYVVVVTNTYGAVTSAPANLVVFGPPVFSEKFPLTYTNLGTTNLMFLYGGSGGYSGSSPSFVVGASGAQPMFYYWFTNGVPVGGANSTNFALTNLSMTGPTTISCVASNFDATTTNIWAVTYLPSPTTPFQAAVMAAQPIAYWRMNDTILDGADNNGGDDGYVCHDYESANDGIYTNAVIGVSSGYSPMTDPSETSAAFGSYNDLTASCDANSIGGANLDFSGSSNAEYTVALWASSDGLTSGFNEPGNSGLFCKGYFSGEEACLDTDPHTFNVRLTLRNAAGTQYNVVSTENLGTDSNWHFIVGECDESNGLVSLYIDGKLEGQSNILSGSGIINSATTPIMLGARSSTATAYGDNQFEGNLNDVAVYNYPLSAGTIASQYEAAGYSITPYVQILTPPPTNVVYLVNSTVTLSATVFGSPPYGYYWTNLTAGGTIASGSTTSFGSLKATLTIPNISGSLSGDQLELVVTNASASANALVNLSAAPAPVTLGYTNSILYSNSFNGGSYSVNGTALSAANILVGGTATTWTATWTNASGQLITVSGSGNVATNQGEVLVPFTPELGYIYTMTGSLIEPSSMSDYIHMGFCQSDAQTSNGAIVRFNDSPINGYDFLALDNALITFYAGPGAINAIGSSSSVPVAPTTNTMQIILNCLTNNGWVASAYINGVAIGTNTYTMNNPPIAFAGIGEQVNPGAEQWQNWAITQFAPGGVPPYLLTAPPTNSILLTNATITLPATAFGSANMGYYWVNNSMVIAAGVTNIPSPSVPNNAAPLPASLSIPSSSLSAGQLDLVVTNAYGTNITAITLISPVNPNPTNIMATVTNSTLYLTWPADHIGWQLQAQTNSVSKGIGANWANYNPSTGVNQVAIPINLTNGTVFYRLTY
jgi:hypothetical protein